MSPATTFPQMLRAEVAKFQALYPARLGELARAHALIMQGFVEDQGDGTATVLASDGQRHYTVNGACDCEGARHGKPCKHRAAWALYQHVQKKLAAQMAPQEHRDPCSREPPAPLPEAPVSITLKASLHGHEVLVTLRGHDFASVKAQVEAASAWLRAQAPLSATDGSGGRNA
jgi:hypothetical protein